jgi:hypothetical protein
MKRSFLTSTVIVLLIVLTSANLLGQGKKGTVSKIKWLDVEKICIEYKMTGMQNGTKKDYFIDWGNETLSILDVVMEMGPIKQRTHTATYMKGNKIYTVDLQTNKGTVTENPMRNLKSEKQAEQFGEDFMKEFGKNVGSKEFLGKICRVFEMPRLGTETLVWKKITLKSVTGFGTMKQIMSAIKLVFNFDEKILNLPTDIKFEEGPNLDDIMKKMRGNLKN